MDSRQFLKTITYPLRYLSVLAGLFWQVLRMELARLRAPEYTRCSRLGCNEVATHGYMTRSGVNLVCRGHVPDYPVAGLQELGSRWWEGEDV
jgi:hypothetical protein